MNSTPFYGNTPYYPTPTYTTPTYMPTSTFQPNVQPSLINGRPVDSLEEITAQEVPLNGSLAVFPKKDGSIIYVKSTNGNGTIDTKMYVPAQESVAPEHAGSSTPTQEPSISNQDILAAIMNIQNQVDNIQQLVEMQKRPRNNKQHNQNGTQGKANNDA